MNAHVYSQAYLAYLAQSRRRPADPVAAAVARTALADLRIALTLAEGHDVTRIDRNGYVDLSAA